MVIKFAELYVQSRGTKKGCKSCKGNTVPTKYGLREVIVNPTHVVCIRPEDGLKHKMLRYSGVQTFRIAEKIT